MTDTTPRLHTRAKFWVNGVKIMPHGAEITMQAVSRGDRNANWATATPVGNLTMTVNNPAAVDRFVEFAEHARKTGRNPEVFIDIYPSEDGWPGDGHQFREADIEPGVYGHGNCGECGNAKDATMSGRLDGDPVHPNG